MGGTASADAIWKDMQTRGIEFVFAQFVDMHARPSAKLVPGSRELDGLARRTAPASPASPPARSARCRATRTSPRSPTSRSFTPVPWQPNLARFACDVTVEGEAWPYCPRTILRSVLARATEHGLRVQDGARARVLPRRRSARTARSRSPTRSTRSRSPATTWPALTRQLRLPDDGLALRATSSAGATTRTTTRTRTASSSRTSTYDDALVTLRPRDLLPLHGPRAGASSAGMIATFMPKPFAHLTGNGCHFHMSLWDGDTNLFLDESTTRAGSGSPSAAYHFIGGLKTHARAYSALTAPTVNSYKRLEDRRRRRAARPGRRSGSRTATTTARRCCASRRPGRIEDRTIDGSCNPYLAAAAVLAAGPRRDRERARRRASRTRRTCTRSRDEELHARGARDRCRRTCSRRRASSRPTTCCARRSARARDEDYVDYFVARASATSGSATTSRSRRGRSTEYLQLF